MDNNEKRLWMDIDRESPEKPVDVYNILNHNFDLCTIPENFMRKRTTYEQLIYKAAFAETRRKSAGASFRLALENSHLLNNIDVVIGVRVSCRFENSFFDSSGLQ